MDGEPKKSMRSMLDHPDIKTSYANQAHILVGDSDIWLFFGTSLPGTIPDDWHPDQKIIMSHATFMRMVEFWATRYQLLYDIYGERVKNINDFPDEEVKAAFDKMLSNWNAESPSGNDVSKVGKDE